MTEDNKQASAGAASELNAELGSWIYEKDNWAHKALLEMNSVENLIKFCAENMTDNKNYKEGAAAFWRVVKMLGMERNRIHFNYECEDCMGTGKEHGCYCQAHGASRAGGS